MHQQYYKYMYYYVVNERKISQSPGNRTALSIETNDTRILTLFLSCNHEKSNSFGRWALRSSEHARESSPGEKT